MKEEKFITTSELCDWLKINKSTASRWRVAGMPHYGKTRAYRYRKTEILKWLDKQENRNTKK